MDAIMEMQMLVDRLVLRRMEITAGPDLHTHQGSTFIPVTQQAERVIATITATMVPPTARSNALDHPPCLHPPGHLLSIYVQLSNTKSNLWRFLLALCRNCNMAS
ncbi:hypothetical protein ACFX2I_028162 [Malus domestica]